MAFNGSGTFNRLYSWVQDAANGINIDSTRMDNETNGIATALSDCVTRDGQSPFTANVPAGGFKITGLGLGVSGTDAANVNNVLAVAANEWTLELNSVAFVGVGSFKVTGANVTASYPTGRRLKITHNTGGTTTYGTVISSSFSTDTTVVVATDGAVSLVSTVTAVSYGLLTYTNPSYLDPRTAVLGYLISANPYTASTITKIAMTGKGFDTNTELSAITGTFTAQHAGYYLVHLNVGFTQTATAARSLVPIIYKNGGTEAQTQINDFIVQPAGGYSDVSVTALTHMDKGDTIEAYFTSANAGTIAQGFAYNVGTRLLVWRLA